MGRRTRNQNLRAREQPHSIVGLGQIADFRPWQWCEFATSLCLVCARKGPGAFAGASFELGRKVELIFVADFGANPFDGEGGVHEHSFRGINLEADEK